MRDYKRFSEIGYIFFYVVTKNVIIRMDYKSFKDLRLAFIIKYVFPKSTIINIIQSIIFSFY